MPANCSATCCAPPDCTNPVSPVKPARCCWHLSRGWRLVAMTRAEGSAFEALSPAAQRTEIETLAGQETPTRGRVLRIWHNDYAEPQFFEKAK